MNALDLLLLALAVLAGAVGYRLGFAARLASWLGLALGLAAGSLAAPWAADRLEDRFDSSELVLISIGIVSFAALLGHGIGLTVGERVRLHVPEGGRRRADRIAGAAAGVLSVAVVTWLLTPAMADVSGWPARQARSSSIVAAVDALFPEPPDAADALRGVLGEDYPQVLDSFDRAPTVEAPPASSGLDQATVDRVARSTVLVRGEACDAITVGSGFVAADGLVATNAHVVAGQSSTTVRTVDGRELDATAVAFDPTSDVAILSVPDLQAAPLPLRTAEVGDTGAVFGHPGGAPLRLTPFTVAQARTARGADIYDEGTAIRDVVVLSAALEHGDSGSALVTPDGTVVGMAFAVAPDRPEVAYALATDEITATLDTVDGAAVSTGACTG